MWFNWNTTRRRHHTTKTPLMDSGDESCFKQFNLLHQFTMHKQFDLTQNGKESKSNRKLENSITPSKTRGLCYKRAPPSKLPLVDWTKHSMLWCIIGNKRRTSILFMRNRKNDFYAHDDTKLPRAYMCRSDYLFWLYIHVLIKFYDMY